MMRAIKPRCQKGTLQLALLHLLFYITISTGSFPILPHNWEIESIKRLHLANPSGATWLMKSKADICAEDGEMEQKQFDKIIADAKARLHKATQRLAHAEYELERCKPKQFYIHGQLVYTQEGFYSCSFTERLVGTTSKPHRAYWSRGNSATLFHHLPLQLHSKFTSRG